MMGGRAIVMLVMVALLLQGCATWSSKTKENPVPVVYPVASGIDVKVTFESKKAYDTAQLGLVLFNKYKEDEKSLRLDDPEFFPEYFALINTDIDDGLLFISDDESFQFSRRVFLMYQKLVMPPEMMKDVRKTQILDEILTKDSEMADTDR